MIIMLNIIIIDTYPLKSLSSKKVKLLEMRKKLKLLEMNVVNNLKFVHDLNQRLFSFTFQTLPLLNFLLEHSRIVFNKRLYHV